MSRLIRTFSVLFLWIIAAVLVEVLACSFWTGYYYDIRFGTNQVALASDSAQAIISFRWNQRYLYKQDNPVTISKWRTYPHPPRADWDIGLPTYRIGGDSPWRFYSTHFHNLGFGIR